MVFGKQALRFLRLAHLLTIIFSCTTSTRISFLHFGQYKGNLTSTVSSYTFVRVLPPQIGQCIHNDFLRLSSTDYTSGHGTTLRSTSGLYLAAVIVFLKLLKYSAYNIDSITLHYPMLSKYSSRQIPASVISFAASFPT